MGKIRRLNNNVLKIIAAISMLLDHIGLILFPSIEIFRILGRIAFPIFAFTIAEGAKYTRIRPYRSDHSQHVQRTEAASAEKGSAKVCRTCVGAGTGRLRKVAELSANSSPGF